MRLALLLAAVCSACCFSTALELDVHLSEEEFEAIYLGKTDDAELEHRKAEALELSETEINRQNAAYQHGESEFFEGLNEESDKPQDVFEATKMGSYDYSTGSVDRALDDPLRVDAYSQAFISQMLADRQAVPASYDARSFGYISSVKNQAQCGSCVAFATVSAVDTCFFLNNGGRNHTDLAEETVIDCGYNGGSMNACSGASPDAYLGYMVSSLSELPHEVSDPYQGTSPYLKCRGIAPLRWGAKVSNRVYTYSCNETMLKQFIYQNGHAVVNANASAVGFKNYAGGIYNTAEPSTGTTHAMVAVGYGVDPADGKTFFIVKNSWGSSWGESGYIRMKSGAANLGKAFCGVSQCTRTNVFSAEPAIPAAATCDVTKMWGALTGTYTYGVNGGTSIFSCTSGICKPTTAQNNACMYICGRLLCN